MANFQTIVGKLKVTDIEVRKELRRRWHNPSRTSTPVFIVGCGRSGTSMLLKQLGKSWKVEYFNENHPEAFDNWRLKDLGSIDMLIRATSAPIVIFKPILNTSQANDFLSFYPSAKILFCFRHYDDVINSSIKKFGLENRIGHVRSWIFNDFAEFSFAPPPNETKSLISSRWRPSLSPESGAALYWLFYNRLYFDLGLSGDNRVRLVQYEKVVANPAEGFASVCEFLGMGLETSMLEGIFSSSVRRDNPPDIDPAIRMDCEALWQRLCTPVTL
ncbi:MAG TPA: sulfotransferase domain-containing protein [Anaerolineales bacterium]|nr:sulfotransferase domain-containing protein [Anaerolineales bacterium]